MNGPPRSATTREEAVSAAVLLVQMERLADGWRRIAGRLERYSPPAAESFRQAAEDLEALRARHGAAVDGLQAIRQFLAGRD